MMGGSASGYSPGILNSVWMKNRLLDLVEVAWLSFLMGWVDVFSLDVCGLGFLVC